MIIAAALVAAAPSARAQSAEPATAEANLTVSGSVIGLSLAGAYLFSLMPVDTDGGWEGELFGGIDERLRGRYSKRAALYSDVSLGLTVTTPLLVQLGRDVDEVAASRALIYGETFGLNLLACAAVKFTVGRPRPYSYSSSASVRSYTEEKGKDSYVSFYSGHASIAFSSAVAGSYLYAADAPSKGRSAAVWMVNMTLASATANLRVRAGKHFYSDVLIGALIGAGIGYAVPALHAGDAGVYAPSPLELGAMAGGVVLGTVASQLLPIDNEGAPSLALAPAMIEGGAGLALSGSLR
jgi:membrane-associated phospholipid phosphatase